MPHSSPAAAAVTTKQSACAVPARAQGAALVRRGKRVRPAMPRAVKAVAAKARWDGRASVWRDGAYWYDEPAGDRAVRFFVEHLVLTEGEWAGRPFVLEAWQEHDVIRPLFGWKRADGSRRYRRCYVWVPRKNGKTELAAGVALLALVGDGEYGGQVYAIAHDESQARIVFDKATAMVARSETLTRWLDCLKPSIYCPELNASFKPLSGRPSGKHGLSMSGLVGDEIHEWGENGARLYKFVHDSAAARRQPVEFLISTAGQNGGYGEDVWHECVKIREGLIEDPETLVVIYAADPDADWTDPAVWAAANPNLGVSKKFTWMEQEAAAARQLPRLVNDFKRYQLNIWTEQTTLWLPIDALDDTGRAYGWDHCAGPVGWAALEERLNGLRCTAGLDLASTQDLSALVLWFPVQDGLDVPAVLARFFKPAGLVRAHGARDRLPYARWVDSGALHATPGNVTDYAFIREQIYRDAEAFRFAHQGDPARKPDQGGLAADPWNATQTLIELEQDGIPVVRIRQGFVSLTAPSKELERLVVSNGFHHGGHPVLREHARAVTVATDPSGNIKPDKRSTTGRIDGIAALVNALAIALADKGEEESVYETRGALVF